MRMATVLAVLVCLATSSPLLAQQRPSSTLVAAALGGVAAGAVVGAAMFGGLNYALAACDNQDGCWGEHFTWGFNGANAGSALAIPAAVHLANRRQGRLAPSLLASAGIGAVGLGVFWGVQRAEGPDALMVGSMIATPVLQIISSIVIERRTSR
jgi:hypothetical protein